MPTVNYKLVSDEPTSQKQSGKELSEFLLKVYRNFETRSIVSYVQKGYKTK